MPEAILPPTKQAREMTEGERCLAWFTAVYGFAAALPDASSLFIELRCMLPRWYRPEQYKRMADISYFPVTAAGLWQAARYVALNRPYYDIYSSIHLRRGESMTDTPYFCALAVDLDAKGSKGGPTAADAHFARAVGERGVQIPHLAVAGRSGFHLYYLLSEFGDMRTPEGVNAYERLAKRLCRAVTGPPDSFDERGRPHWDGPTADDGAPTRPSATLRPVGSFNHGGEEKDEPVPVTLALYRPGLERRSLLWWKEEAGLPRLRDEVNTLPDEFKRRKSLMDDGIKPYERRPIPRRTREFLVSGADGEKAANHTRLLTAASDLAWAGYTQDEANDLITRHVSRYAEDERKIRDIVFRSPGKKFEWNDTPCHELPEIKIW